MGVLRLATQQQRRRPAAVPSSAAHHWRRHLDAGEAAAALFEDLGALLASQPAALALLGKLEQAVAECDLAALRAVQAAARERAEF